ISSDLSQLGQTIISSDIHPEQDTRSLPSVHRLSVQLSAPSPCSAPAVLTCSVRERVRTVRRSVPETAVWTVRRSVPEAAVWTVRRSLLEAAVWTVRGSVPEAAVWDGPEVGAGGCGENGPEVGAEGCGVDGPEVGAGGCGEDGPEAALRVVASHHSEGATIQVGLQVLQGPDYDQALLLDGGVGHFPRQKFPAQVQHKVLLVLRVNLAKHSTEAKLAGIGLHQEWSTAVDCFQHRGVAQCCFQCLEGPLTAVGPVDDGAPAYPVPQVVDLTHAHLTLSGFDSQFILVNFPEHLLEMLQLFIPGGTKDGNVIQVRHLVLLQSLKQVVHHPLESGMGILHAEGHDRGLIESKGCDKGGLLLHLGAQGNLPVSLTQIHYCQESARAGALVSERCWAPGSGGYHSLPDHLQYILSLGLMLSLGILPVLLNQLQTSIMVVSGELFQGRQQLTMLVGRAKYPSSSGSLDSVKSQDILPKLLWIIQMLSSKLQTGPDKYWLKQWDTSGTAGSESMVAYLSPIVEVYL
ncbi:unnamed protein product, partial [Ranitomeya imitator]